MGYHLTEIEKGELGKFSKIREEFLEAEDSFSQGNPIMVLLELSDLIGAIEAYVINHNMSLEDIICLLYTSPSPRDRQKSRMPSSA